MSRFLRHFINFALLASAIAADPNRASAHANASSGEMAVTVGFEDDFKPYAYGGAKGEPEGFAEDLLRAVARHASLKLNYRIGSWVQTRQALENGEVDAVAIMAKSRERAKKVDFSDTHIVAYDAIFVRNDNDTIQSQKDLVGKRVVVETGDLAADYLFSHNTGVAKIMTVDTILDAFKMIAIGQADAFVVSQMVGIIVINENELKSVRLAAHPRFGDYQRDYAFAIRKEHRELLNRINEGLRAVIATGEYGLIYDKWFAKFDSTQQQQAKRQRQLLIFLLLAAVVSAVFVFVLKIEVNRKTRSLEQSEARFRSLVENSPGVVFRVSKSGKEHNEFYSDALERITGYSPDEVSSGQRKFTDLIHPDDLEAVTTVGQAAFLHGGPFKVEFRVICKNGEIRWLHSQGSGSTDKRDGSLFLDGLIVDITEQKRVNELLTQHQSKMASSARLSALGEMAGGIAHEINNPLTIINLRTHQLTQLACRGDVKASEALTIASGIESTAIRISKIIKSLQTVARESAHDPFEDVSINDIVGDAFELCYQRMKKHGVNVFVDEIPPQLRLECRRVQISQVLINLLNNAFDAVVNLSNRFIRITARTTVHNGREGVELAIIDSGRDIAKDVALKIFQPFFTTKGPGKGTGLGLSISKGMIEAHEGEIWLDTDYPTTRFVIFLPRHQPQHTQQAEPKSASASTKKRDTARAALESFPDSST